MEVDNLKIPNGNIYSMCCFEHSKGSFNEYREFFVACLLLLSLPCSRLAVCMV